jgi:hypothetical protein
MRRWAAAASRRTDFRYDDTKRKASPDPSGDQHPARHDADLAGAGTGAHMRDFLSRVVPLDRGGRLMRSLKSERKPRRNPRAKATPGRTNGARIPPERLTFRQAQEAAQRHRLALCARSAQRLMPFAPDAGMLTAGLPRVHGDRRPVRRRRGRAARSSEPRTRLSCAGGDAGFGISSVQISGNRRTPQKTIMAALDIQPGQIQLLLRRSCGARAAAAVDWVAEAEVRRRYPDSDRGQRVEKHAFRPVADRRTALRDRAFGQRHREPTAPSSSACRASSATAPAGGAETGRRHRHPSRRARARPRLCSVSRAGAGI